MLSNYKIFAPKEWFRDLPAATVTSEAGSADAPSSSSTRLTVHIDRWLRKEGSGIKPDDVIAEVSVSTAPISSFVDRVSDGAKANRRLTLRAGRAGILSRILVPSGHSVPVELSATTGESLTELAEVKDCDHPMLFGGMCVACGATKQQLALRSSGGERTAGESGALAGVNGGESEDFDTIEDNANSKLPRRSLKSNSILVGKHSIELSQEEALRRKGLLSLGLQRVRKLALILDLDNTLIHACPAPYMEEGQPSGMEENMHYIRFTEQMISQGPMVTKFANKQAHYIKLRDGLADFLAATSRLYQLSVYTHGTRAYAEAVVAKLDPDKTLMGKRIVSRTDTNNKNIKSLENLFLDDWSMVVVMDDREDVWLDGGKQQHMHLLKVIGFYHAPFMPSQPVPPAIPAPITESEAASVPTSNLKPLMGLDIDDSQVSHGGNASDTAAINAPPKKPAPTDHQLPRCLEILSNIHSQYYEQLEKAGSEKPSTATILVSLRSRVLEGCCLSFSGEFDVSMLDEVKAQQPRWRFAVALGAVVQPNITEFTTHVIVGVHASGRSTSKAREAEARGSIYVVQWLWLDMCYCYMRRVDEGPYLLAPAPVQLPRNIEELPLWEKDHEDVQACDRSSRKRKEFASQGQDDRSGKSSRIVDDFSECIDVGDSSVSGESEGTDPGWLEEMEGDLNAALTGDRDES